MKNCGLKKPLDYFQIILSLTENKTSSRRQIFLTSKRHIPAPLSLYEKPWLLCEGLRIRSHAIYIDKRRTRRYYFD